MSERCAERVADGWHFRHCSRKAIKDGYCKQHHPDSVKARQDKADARYEEQRANSIYTKYDKALKRIAELEQQVRWIPCSERLPDESDKRRVLAYTDADDEVTRFRLVASSLFRQACSDATAWKYVEPPPPSENDNE